MKVLFPLITVLLVASCSSDHRAKRTTADQGERARAGADGAAVVVLKNSSGLEIGRLTLTEANDGVRIAGDVSSLPPGKHGMHIHENGVCDAPGFTTAGAHYNPSQHPHGGLEGDTRHVGDLGNIDVGSDGRAVVDVTARNATLRNEGASLFKQGGTALLIHAKEDDQKTPPSGNSGDRIACGVIQRQ